MPKHRWGPVVTTQSERGGGQLFWLCYPGPQSQVVQKLDFLDTREIRRPRRAPGTFPLLSRPHFS